MNTTSAGLVSHGLIVVIGMFVSVRVYGDESAAAQDFVRRANALSIEDHVAAAAALNDALLQRLLQVDAEVKEEWAEFAAAKDQGVNKLINRGIIDSSTRIRGGGAYFSFVTGSNSYDESPQLELQHFRFSSGFYGGSDGVVVELPVNDVQKVKIEDCPIGLTMGHADPVRELSRLQAADRRADLTATVGKVFAVRWASYREADTLAAFQVVAKDTWTVTIAWRVLRHFPVPNR